MGAAIALLIAGRGWNAHAAEESNAYTETDARILAEVHDHSELMENLEYLSDRIGPRLTGSDQLKQANEWAAGMFKKYGLSNVHLEPYTIPHGWTRGTAVARIVAPTARTLTITSSAWTPGTKGKIRGPVVFLDARKKEEFDKYRGKLRNAIVIMRQPMPLSPAKPIDQNAEIYHAMEEPPAPVGQPAVPDPWEKYLQAMKLQMEFLRKEGVAAVLRDAGKPQALLNMADGTLEPFQPALIPSAFLTGEDYRLIYRMVNKGPVEIELEIKNAFSKKPMEVYNTVAELPGTDKADEVVILGAHLDSWDLASGTTDNGTGSMAVLEAARTLAKLNLKPRRTIRFILFTGEEQGLVGSKEYLKAHQADQSKISAALVHDSGTGRVLTIGLHDNYQAREIVDQVIAPLSDLKLLEPTLAREDGTDSLSFDEVGIPGFWCAQAVAEYPLTHHSQSDTFDKAWKADIEQGAQVLAAWAYNTSMLPAMLPRRPLPPAPAKPNEAAKDVPAPADSIGEADKNIIEKVKAEEPRLKDDLTYLTTQIGPRLTGSPQLDQASKWALEQFKSIGLENVHLEPWSIAHGWKRGPISAKVITPSEHVVSLAAAGWSPPTNGTVTAEIVGIATDNTQDLEQYKGRLAGKIVLLGRVQDLVPPSDPILTPWSEGTIPLMHPANPKAPNRAEQAKARTAAMKLLEEEKALAVLISSEKLYDLLNMTTFSKDYQPGKITTAFAAREDYLLLWRLVEGGSPVRMELNVQSSFTESPVEVYNTVGEIRGGEKPDEVVIIGAHLDSWDLGTGATDNGTGSMAVLAAARALKKSGLKPKRTVRFVLFTGEEQGLNGSKEYVRAHKDELPKISGVLVHDSGTGRVLTIGLMGNYNVRETIGRVMYPLAEPTGFMEPTLRSEGGSDHIPFDQAGVPGFWCVQEPANYEKTHHSQADVLERVQWDDLTEGAQVLAVFAYNTAQLDDLLPRKSSVKK